MNDPTPEEARNQFLTIGVITALLLLCLLTYALRLVSRRMLHTPLAMDDWFMAFTLTLCVAMSILDYVGVRLGSGVHRVHLTSDEYKHFLINLYVFELGWAASVTVVKVSILMFYWRIFAVKGFRRRVLALGIFIVAIGTATFFTLMFQCTPIPFFWTGAGQGSCVAQVRIYIAGGSLNILGDILVLILPLRQVWSLKTSQKQRMALTFLFLLGSFVCVTSIFRILALKQVDPDDFTWSNLEGGIWSTVEPQVGFICANLPHVRPLIRHLFSRSRALFSSSKNGRNTVTQRSRTLSTHTGSGFWRLHEAKAADIPSKGTSAQVLNRDDFSSELDSHELEEGLTGQITVKTQVSQSVTSGSKDNGNGNGKAYPESALMTFISTER